MKRCFRYTITVISFILCLIVLLFAWEAFSEQRNFVNVQYEKQDISELARKNILSEEDYKVLYLQTGLGQPAIDSLRKEKNSAASILQFQESFFAPRTIECNSIFFPTKQETIHQLEEQTEPEILLAPLEDGYVLITNSVHFFGWRHGHAALVVNAEQGITLEAFGIGTPSNHQDIKKWKKYSSLLILKLKNASPMTIQKIVQCAEEHYIDLPYKLTTGLFGGKFKEADKLQGTQCAHLIWSAFYASGFDIDSNGGWLVTPRDIANSPLFEVVQVYGMDLESIWK